MNGALTLDSEIVFRLFNKFSGIKGKYFMQDKGLAHDGCIDEIRNLF